MADRADSTIDGYCCFLAGRVDPCGFPVDAVVRHDKNGEQIKRTQFIARVANGTKPLHDEQKQKYLKGRWSAGAAEL